MARLEDFNWAVKLNIKLEFIYLDRLISLLVRMDVIYLFIYL